MSFFSMPLVSGGIVCTKDNDGSLVPKIEKLRRVLDDADAVVVGAGAGMSTAAGLTYSGARFDEHFADFRDAFGITDMYSGGFYPFPDMETFWAWWSRHIYYNRYDAEPGRPYLDLLQLVKDKDYFVITTNVDHQFQLAGFDKHPSSAAVRAATAARHTSGTMLLVSPVCASFALGMSGEGFSAISTLCPSSWMSSWVATTSSSSAKLSKATVR